MRNRRRRSHDAGARQRIADDAKRRARRDRHAHGRAAAAAATRDACEPATQSRRRRARRRCAPCQLARCERLLEEDRRGERVDVRLCGPRVRAAHLADRAQRGRGRVSLVDKRHGKSGALRQLGRRRRALRRSAACRRRRRRAASPITKPRASSASARRTISAIGGRFPRAARSTPAGDAIVPVGSLIARPTRRSP